MPNEANMAMPDGAQVGLSDEAIVGCAMRRSWACLEAGVARGSSCSRAGVGAN